MPPPVAPHLHDRPLASDSITAGSPPQAPPGAVAGSPVPTGSKPPSSLSPASQSEAEHEDQDPSRQHPPPDSASTLEPSPAPSTEPASVPPKPATPGHSDLIDAWHHYWRVGDGHFKAGGLENQLTASGFTAKVIDGAEVGAGDHVLIVDTQSPDKHFFVLPSFARSPRSVQHWFHDQSGGALTGTTRQVNSLAVGRWTDSGAFEVVKKGAVS